MSASTQLGERRPGGPLCSICSLSGRLFLSAVAWLVLPDRQSLAVGVANWRRFSPAQNRSPVSASLDRLAEGCSVSVAIGVGHVRFTSTANTLPAPFPLWRVCWRRSRLLSHEAGLSA